MQRQTGWQESNSAWRPNSRYAGISFRQSRLGLLAENWLEVTLMGWLQEARALVESLQAQLAAVEQDISQHQARTVCFKRTNHGIRDT